MLHTFNIVMFTPLLLSPFPTEIQGDEVQGEKSNLPRYSKMT